MKQRKQNRLRAKFDEIRKELGLEENGIDSEVLEFFLLSEDHLSAGELAERLRKAGHDVRTSVVSATLKQLESFGLAERVELADGVILWQQLVLERHHDHLICVKCGRIVDVFSPEMERIQDETADAHGFSSFFHRHEIYGLCADCRKNRSVATMPLSIVFPGEWVRVVGIDGGKNAVKRLEAMAIVKDAKLRVLQKPGAGQMILQVENARYALGQGMASKVRVVPIQEPEKDKVL